MKKKYFYSAAFIVYTRAIKNHNNIKQILRQKRGANPHTRIHMQRLVIKKTYTYIYKTKSAQSLLMQMPRAQAFEISPANYAWGSFSISIKELQPKITRVNLWQNIKLNRVELID